MIRSLLRQGSVFVLGRLGACLDAARIDQKRTGQIVLLAALALPCSSQAAYIAWRNTATDFNTGSSWSNGVAPGAADYALFSEATPSFQPDLSASLSIRGLTYSFAGSSGWTLGSANGSTLTLTSDGVGSASAISANNSSGVNTINLDLTLGGPPDSSLRFAQARGGTLVIEGSISESTANSGINFLSSGSGISTYTFSGDNSYSGGTRLPGSTIFNLNSATAIGSGPLIASGTGSIDNQSETASLVLTYNNNIELSNGSLIYVGTGGNNLSFGSGMVSVIGANRSITVNGGTLTVGGIDADTTDRTFSKAGAGTLAITGPAGANFQNLFILSSGAGGSLIIGDKAALGSGALSVTVSNNLYASTDLSGANAIANSIRIAAPFTVAGTNSITFSGGVTNYTSSRSVYSELASGKTLTFSGPLYLSDNATAHTLTFAGSGDFAVSGVIADINGVGSASGIGKSGTGTLTLSGVNTYSAATSISDGRVVLSGSGTLGSGAGALAMAGGALDLGGLTTPAVAAVTITAAASSGDTIRNGELTGTSYSATHAAGNVIISAALKGAGTLIKNGAGTLTLSGANTYSGQSSIYGGGMLSVNSLNYIASGTLSPNTSSSLGKPTTVAAGTILLGSNAGAGTLRYTGSGETTDRVIDLRGTTGGAVLDQSGASGLLKFSRSFTAIGGGAKTLTLQGSTAGVGEIAGAIIDNSSSKITSLAKEGTGTWILSGNSTYRGTTAINVGKLVVSGTYGASGTGAVSVAASATLAGDGTLRGPTAVSGIISPGSSAGVVGQLNIVNETTWHGGGGLGSSATDWVFDLGAANASDVLNLTGNFTKGSGSAFRFNFGGSTQEGTFTLVKWTGTTLFSADDFSYVNLGGGNAATFQVDNASSPRTLKVVIQNCASTPTITLGSSPTVCTNTTTTSLPYTGTTDSPDQYFIDYDSTANTVGLFTDVGVTALGASPLPITVSAFAPPGVYAGTLTVLKSATGCRSSVGFTVTVIGSPSQPGAISGTSAICAGVGGMTYSIAAVSGATTYHWSVPSGASITAGAGTTQITVNWGATSGNVTVNAQNSCFTGANQTLAVTVRNGIPAAPTLTAATEISTTSFIANWSALAEADSYRLDVASDPEFASGLVVNNESLSGTSRSLTGLASGAAYYYRVRAVNACGTGGYSTTNTVLTPYILAGWDVSGMAGGSGDYGASPLAPTTYATGQVTVVGLTRGTGVAQDGTAAARGWGGTAWNGADAAAAVSASQYASNTITATSGRNVSFFSISKLSYRRDATGPTSGALQYSVDGTTYHTIASPSYPSADSAGSAIDLPVDLAGISALQNVPASTPVTFRIVNHGASDAAGAWYVYDTDNTSASDFEIRGTICVNPTVYNVTGGGSYCSDPGTGVAVGLASSQKYVTYQMYTNGGLSAVGAPVAGTGGAISFGLQTEQGTYTVVATRNAGGCSVAMNGSAAVTRVATPSEPTDPQVVVGSGQAALSWVAPAETTTGYKVKRSQTPGGPYTTVTGGSNVSGLSFSDTSVLDGNTYYYVIVALNDGCESAASAEVEAVMPANCPGGVPPVLTQPGNRTVTHTHTLSLSITASDSSVICPSPGMVNSTLPVGMTTEDVTVNDTRTRTFTWYPQADQVGTYPITVTATDGENLSTSVSFIVFVGSSGEPNNGTTNPPPSQADWNIVITDLVVPSSGNATVVWTSVDGVMYDLYSSTLPIGGGASWTKEVSAVEADGTLSTSSVPASGNMRFYQVVPQGQSRTDRGVWGVVRTPITSGIALQAPPLVGDRRFDGALGASLAATVPAGSKVHIMTDPTPNWQTLQLTGGGQWLTSPGGVVYSTPLGDGQAYFIEGASGTTPVFKGPVGNDGSSSQALEIGFNLISVSEGKGLSVTTAFSSANPVGNSDEALADQVILQNSNGSWRRLVRLPTGVWYDMSTPGTASLTLMPGQAYYYIRRNSDTTVTF